MEHLLVRHCSPTFASLKVGSLVNIRNNGENQRAIDRLVSVLPKGLSMSVLKVTERMLLIYLYNEDLLESLLENDYHRQILLSYDYPVDSTEKALLHLSLRLQRESFPHEIGLFLGYPVEDVLGFIKHKGQNYMEKGYWKVYQNVPNKLSLFEAYDDCRMRYSQLMDQGFTLQDILKHRNKE
ncbi:MAG: DUF3793 family protein [Tissierellia bacterium]|nr:DUF3793 family protein [Tissierellia bacterium]